MPELPEVETMVRGLRPALEGRRLRRLEVLDASLVHGCSADELARFGRGATVVDVGRRGKWVVVTLAGHRGTIVIQPRMTGGFWLREPDRPEHIRLVFHVDKPRAMVWYCDTRRLGRIGWYPDASAAAVAFAGSHGPDALEITRAGACQAALAHSPRHQARAHGSEGAGRNRQHLRGRGAAPRQDSPRAGSRFADRARIGPIAPRRSVRSCESRSSSRDRVSTRDIERFWDLKEVSSPRTRSTAARASHAGAVPRPITKTRIAGLIGRPTYFCARCQVLR